MVEEKECGESYQQSCAAVDKTRFLCVFFFVRVDDKKRWKLLLVQVSKIIPIKTWTLSWKLSWEIFEFSYIAKYFSIWYKRKMSWAYCRLISTPHWLSCARNDTTWDSWVMKIIIKLSTTCWNVFLTLTSPFPFLEKS